MAQPTDLFVLDSRHGGGAKGSLRTMQRVSIPFLEKDRFDELRAIPGVVVSKRSVAFPPDCAEIVGGILGAEIAPELPAPRPLAVDPESIRGWSKFRPWQKEGTVHLAQGIRRLLWLVPGSGKTGILLAAAELKGAKKTLVVTRTLGIRSFIRDSKWAVNLSVGVVRGRGPDFTVEALYQDYDVICLNYEILEARLPSLGRLKFDAVIFDEAHYLCSHQHKSYAHWTKAAEQIAETALVQGNEPWLATATPVRDRRRDLWRPLKIAYPDSFADGWRFMKRYCAGYLNSYGGLETKGKSNTEELYTRLRPYIYRKTKAEVSAHLPKLTREIIVIEAEGATKKKIPRSVEGQLAEAASRKIDTAVELALDHLMGPGKVLLVTSRRNQVAKLDAALRKAAKHIPNVVSWATHGSGPGGHTAEQRVEIASQYFNAPDPAWITATMDSMGESLDLQRTDALIYLMLPNSPRLEEQVSGRVARDGQDRPCTIYFIVAAGTIDEVIRESLLDKLVDIDSLKIANDSGAAATIRGAPDEEEVLAALNKWVGSTNYVEGVDEDD